MTQAPPLSSQDGSEDGAGLRAINLSELQKTARVHERAVRNDGVIETSETIAERCIQPCVRPKDFPPGNGGSAADAQHLAGEFVSKLAFDRPGLARASLDRGHLGSNRDR